MELYTVSLYAKVEAEALGIPVLDTTIKSGDQVFAPSWGIVMKYKDDLNEATYTKVYNEMMVASRLKHLDHWLKVLKMDSVAIACYCYRGKFCHRVLLVSMFEELAKEHEIPFEYKGEIYKHSTKVE